MNRLFFSLCIGAVGCALALQFPSTAIAQSKETVLHSFAGPPGDGKFPVAGVIDVNGTLYGTTAYGGLSSGCDYGCGMVFSLDIKTGAEAAVYSFQGGTDGKYPYASLIDVSGTLYGTTSAGGASGEGTVFSLNPKTGAETVLHSFGPYGGGDGGGPYDGLIDVNGTLYGTTISGGAHYDGTVFSVDPTTGKEKVLHSFDGFKGRGPLGGLIDLKGRLYGTTYEGGAYGYGTAFSVNPSGRGADEKVVHEFANGPDGAYPHAGLIDVNGFLYGTTVGGGAHMGRGTVFAINPMTGRETVLHSFGRASDGAKPVSDLIDVKGTIYGTTSRGGSGKAGTVFALRKP